MATSYWIRTMLELRGIPFEELRHADVYTAQEMAQCEHWSGHHVAKVVAVMADDRPVALVLPASRRVLLGRLANILKANRVRLATENEMERYFPDCEVGAIPPLRHWEGVEVYMDGTLQTPGDIIFPAGTHGDAIRLGFRDWYELVNPQVARFSEPAEFAYT